MRIIFLDHYGVMCRATPGTLRTEHSTPTVEELRGRLPWEPFDQDCVCVLNDILAAADADIVVTSDWKHSKNLADIGLFYAAQGVIKQPIGVTSRMRAHTGSPAQIRAAEIRQWLAQNRVSSWCAVDDLCMDLVSFAWAQDPHAGLTAPCLAEQIKTALTIR